METPADLLLQRVIALVEPLTRFDRSSLSRGPERSHAVEGNATWNFVPEFHIERVEGAGGLPGGVNTFSAPGQAEGAAQTARGTAQARLPQKLGGWADAAGSDNSALRASDCFDGPQTFGAGIPCASCSGQGRTRCVGCGGRGRSRCLSCSGSRKANCRKCGGSGTEACGTCGGMGRQTQYVTKQVWDGFNNRYVSQSATETTNCSACLGRGTRTCFTCSGARTVTCWGCGGAGDVHCGQCGASGYVNCSSCGATGTRHRYWKVWCSVSSTFGTNVADENPEIVSRLRSCSLDQLRGIATVRQGETSASSTSARRNYSFSCQVCEMIIEVGENRAVRLVGYGDDAKVFDYKNIVEVLLEEDLKRLEQAVKQSSRISVRPERALVEAVQLCLLSEANAQIGEGPDGAQRLKALGGLTDDYAQRITGALRTAFRRLYFGHIAQGAALAIFVPSLLFLGFHLVGWTTKYLVEALSIPLLAGAGVYVAAELIARNGMKKLFGGNRIEALLRGQKITRRWRVITAGGAIALFLAAVSSV